MRIEVGSSLPRGRVAAARVAAVLGVLLAVAGGAASAQQQLGQKVLGAAGINAGIQADSGLYLIDRFLRYSADRLLDREGRRVPIEGLDVDARANAIGAALTLKPRGWPFVTVAAGVPLAKISLNSDDPRVSLDRQGLGDLIVQPLKLGWRWSGADAVAAYTFYAPTGRFEPRRGGVGRGFWTHQFSLGGGVFRNRPRAWRASALASYDLNMRKRGIDIRRGNTIQVQGGAGVGVLRVALVGVAGYALWQVSDDRGTDVPPALRGLRTRVYALGPELNVVIPRLRLAGELRVEREFGVRARMQGQVLVAGITYQAWRA
ncbi:MAG: transporter, partial [Gemmatimonadetes bacterium]|nr:transporter [Gemmatimonadota bacterium]